MVIIKKKINKSTLKGSSIDYYNDLLIKEYKKHNITEFVIFESEKLKIQVQESKHFMKGLIAYLSEVDKQLNKLSNNDQLKSWAFQIIAELGTLIYPNAGTCYSLIPQDLKQINWKLENYMISQFFHKLRALQWLYP